MNKNILAASVLAATAGLASSQDIVKIGHVAGITGPVAYFGKDTENATRMAIEHLNARGTTIAGRKVTFQLVAEDDAGDPKQATSVAQKLVDAKVNGVIGHQTSGTTIPASKIYHTGGIPQISPSSTSPKYTQQGFNTAFRTIANDVQLGQALGRYATGAMKVRRVAVVDDRTAYGQGLVMEFSRSLQQQGGTIVAREFTNDKATDFSAIVTRIRATKPDMVFFGGLSATAGPMLRQLSGGTMVDGQVVCAEAGGVRGEGKAGMDKFRADYKKRFGIDVQINAPYAYDATMVMADAMVKAGSAVPAKYLPFLAKANYKGVTGPVAFDARGDVRDGTITLYGFKGGKRSLITVTK